MYISPDPKERNIMTTSPLMSINTRVATVRYIKSTRNAMQREARGEVTLPGRREVCAS